MSTILDILHVPQPAGMRNDSGKVWSDLRPKKRGIKNGPIPRIGSNGMP